MPPAPIKLHGLSTETVSHTLTDAAAFKNTFCLLTMTSNNLISLFRFTTGLEETDCPQMLFSGIGLQGNRASNLETPDTCKINYWHFLVKHSNLHIVLVWAFGHWARFKKKGKINIHAANQTKAIQI